MSLVEINTAAPDFSMPDYQDNPISLSQFKGKKNVIVVLNRGFT